MAMSSTNLFTSLPSSRTHIPLHTNFPTNHNHVHYTNNNSHNKRDIISLPAVASIPYQPVNLDYLETEFSGHGVTFSSIGDDYCIVKMGLDNGSLATLMLPSGLITSYKAPMWHGGTLEILHTSVSEGEDGEENEAVIQGGVSIAICCGSGEDDDDDESSWSPQTWTLHQVRGNSNDSIKVELISIDSEKMVEVKQIITLEDDTLTSQIVISNSKPSPVQLMGSVIAHLTLSTTEATYAIGLEGSDFFTRPPFLSNFSVIPPDFGIKKTKDNSQQVWGSMGLKRFLSGFNANPEDSSKQDEEMDGEESDNYKHLTDQMSRIYTSAPRDFTIIDRGRRNSVMVGREGFEELYMFSPGSTLERYGKFDYLCVGQSALLKPITIAPGETWKGSMQLHNPNL